MTWKSVIVLVPMLTTIIGLACLLAVVFVWRRKLKKQHWESPLNHNLLRPPGYSLQLKVDEFSGELSVFFTCFLLFPVIVYAVHISQSHFGGQPESTLRTVTTIMLGAVINGLLGYRLLRLLPIQKNYVQGLEGEMFTGAELNLLMLEGCRVYHDIPFPYGNIDHVVVSQSGVFSVNTKTWSKAKKGNDRAKATVNYEKNIIQFSGWSRPIPTSQLEAESHWLSTSLTSSVGKKIGVESILALPGWYINNGTGKNGICVINPLNARKFFVHNRQVYSPQEIQQIADKLELLCRNVKPSYREKREWNE